MSELAFNLSGERFQVAPTAAFWRVRRLKPGGRGTPEVVFGSDGAPLVIPIETGLEDFRNLVREQPGRYRLDPIDEDQHGCEGAVPAYLHMAEDGGGAAKVGDQGALVRELARSNADIVRTITEQFAGVIQAAAQLIRAADGAGLPAREPAATQPRNAAPAEVVETSDKADDEPLARVLYTAVEQVMPIVNYAINTKVMGLTPEQALALAGKTPTPAANSEKVSAQAISPTTARRQGTVGGEARQEAKIKEAPKAARNADMAGKDFVGHLQAIEKLLSTDEVAMVRAAVMQMAPEALAVWRERITAVSAEEAAELVRAEIAGGQS
jgi:hypothetical protein